MSGESNSAAAPGSVRASPASRNPSDPATGHQGAGWLQFVGAAMHIMRRGDGKASCEEALLGAVGAKDYLHIEVWSDAVTLLSSLTSADPAQLDRSNAAVRLLNIIDGEAPYARFKSVSETEAPQASRLALGRYLRAADESLSAISPEEYAIAYESRLAIATALSPGSGEMALSDEMLTTRTRNLLSEDSVAAESIRASMRCENPYQTTKSDRVVSDASMNWSAYLGEALLCARILENRSSSHADRSPQVVNSFKISMMKARSVRSTDGLASPLANGVCDEILEKPMEALTKAYETGYPSGEVYKDFILAAAIVTRENRHHLRDHEFDRESTEFAKVASASLTAELVAGDPEAPKRDIALCVRASIVDRASDLGLFTSSPLETQVRRPVAERMEYKSAFAPYASGADRLERESQLRDAYVVARMSESSNPAFKKWSIERCDKNQFLLADARRFTANVIVYEKIEGDVSSFPWRDLTQKALAKPRKEEAVSVSGLKM
jgi:hypothetical protein